MTFDNLFRMLHLLLTTSFLHLTPCTTQGAWLVLNLPGFRASPLPCLRPARRDFAQAGIKCEKVGNGLKPFPTKDFGTPYILAFLSSLGGTFSC